MTALLHKLRIKKQALHSKGTKGCESEVPCAQILVSDNRWYIRVSFMLRSLIPEMYSVLLDVAPLVSQYTGTVTQSNYELPEFTIYIVAVSPDGRNIRPKHVVYVINKFILGHLLCSIDRKIMGNVRNCTADAIIVHCPATMSSALRRAVRRRKILSVWKL